MSVMLAQVWKGQDPTGWWMSAKFDGVRAYWDGSALRSRLGNVFHAPTRWTDVLPRNAHLDGELYLGPGLFQDTVSIVRKKTPGPAWSRVMYVLFDMPSHPGPFEERVRALEKLRGSAPHIRPAKHYLCEGEADLHEFHQQMKDDGVEGVMLRAPRSPYERRRSNMLLKVKDFETGLAVIEGYTPGAGKHAGRLGAYEARMLPRGPRFKIGTGISDAERRRPLAKGTVVEFSYQELTRDGVPRFPALIGPRDYE